MHLTPNAQFFFMLNVISYICIVNTFFVLYCQYSLHSLLPNCHDLWPIMQAVLLTFKFFQRDGADKNKLQQQGSFTQIFNRQLKLESWFWPTMQAVLLTFKYFQRVDKTKLQQQRSFTQIFNIQLKSDSWLCLAGGFQELLEPPMALYTLLARVPQAWGQWACTTALAASGTWM